MRAPPGPTSPISGLFAGRYAVERVLGEGATATVYLARDREAGTAVAIKVLRPELAESAAASRFIKEIRRTTELNHPRILPVLDSGEADGHMYIVLPYMEGGTLRTRLQREKQLPIDEAIAIIRPIAEALDYAHGRGVIHRDVKPENILFTDGQAVLGDFGIARALENVLNETTTSTGIVRGTPTYMSPEQASGSKDYDGRSDQYSLACVLYEMLAGMPAFIGPTPEAVIAQRFAHKPREIRVYRSSVTRALDQAVAKALALAPADRYRTVGEFLETVETARTAVDPPAPLSGRAVRIGLVTGAVLTLGAAAVWLSDRPSSSVFAPAPDTTRVVILPFENAATPYVAEDLLYEGLQRWRGLSIVETFATSDAVRQHGEIRSLTDAQAIALSLGAGRYIRGRLIQNGTARAVYAALYDAASNRELHHARLALGEADDVHSYAALADSLVLRGARDASAPPYAASVSLPSTQAFLRARAALGDWDLVLADSLFEQSVAFDSTNVRADLWLAQVRSWRRRPAPSWSLNAQRAAAAAVTLSAQERELAIGLAALANQDYSAACATYRTIAQTRPRDFAGWFGQGECIRLDQTVVPDTTSPSGWRFRSSNYQAMLAYRRAFEVMPSSHRGFERAAYQPLQRLLNTDGIRLLRGVSADRQEFLARPTATGDTIEFIPYRRADVLAGAVADPHAVARAAQLARRMFHDVARAWASAFPRSAGTQEAVAVSLEMLGDITAARDSFRLARRLATDPTQRLRLGVSEVVTSVKLALSRDASELGSAVALADSILTGRSPRDSIEAELLSRLAVLSGRCSLSADLARRTGVPAGIPGVVPPAVLASAKGDIPRIALGCVSASRLTPVYEQLRGVISSEDERSFVEYWLIGPLVAMGYPENRAAIGRLARTTSDYVLRTQHALLTGDTAAARATLTRILAVRGAQTTDLTGDVAFTEARLLLAVRDTAAATALLDRALSSIATAQPLYADASARTILGLAGISRVLALRSELAVASGGSGARWANLLAALWKNADPELQPLVQRMRVIASR